LGKTIIALGSFFIVLSIANILRFTLCLVTDNLAIFLDTTTAYPSEILGITTIKCGDVNRRPLRRAVGKSARGNLFLR